MALISDVLLAFGAIGAGIYCFVLSRRLARFTDLEKGVGGAVAVLSVQVDELTKALEAAQRTAASSSSELEATAIRAEAAANRLDHLLGSLQSSPETLAQRPSRTVRRSRRKEPEPVKEAV